MLWTDYASEFCIYAGNDIEESWCSQTEKYELSTQIELLLRKRKTDYKLERNFLFELVGIIFYFTINWRELAVNQHPQAQTLLK